MQVLTEYRVFKYINYKTPIKLYRHSLFYLAFCFVVPRKSIDPYPIEEVPDDKYRREMP